MQSGPHKPYSGHLEGVLARIEQRAAEAEPVVSPHPGAPAALRDAVTQRLDALAPHLIALARDIHAHPELGFSEHHAVAALAQLLERHGHTAVTGMWGLPTALRAQAGSRRPRIAVLAEYDALPGIGHACGHNVICAAAAGAFLAVAAVADELDGSIELIGTPAEEGGGGKELIARAGGFDDVDAAAMVHPSSFDVAVHPWLGVRQVNVAYSGLAAHASNVPFLGRNALDAVVTAYNGIAQLRQHILPTDRVHGVITDGGQRPNIVPERAAATFYLRSAEPDTLTELSGRAEAIFRAAADATGTTVEIGWDPCPIYLPMRNNRALAARYAMNVTARGRRVLPPGIVPEYLTGSTDMGNISVRVPSIHPMLAIAPLGVAIHSPEFATWAASEEADRGVLDGAAGLALSALDYLTDAGLRGEVAKEFETDGGGGGFLHTTMG